MTLEEVGRKRKRVFDQLTLGKSYDGQGGCGLLLPPAGEYQEVTLKNATWKKVQRGREDEERKSGTN